MTHRTQSVLDHIENVLSGDLFSADEDAILELVQRMLSDGNGFNFSQLQRPDPVYYKKLLRADADQHAGLIEGKSKDARMFRIAYEDLCEVLGSFSGPGLTAKDFPSGKRSNHVLRLEALNLCLEVQPQARREAIALILSKHLGAAPLHMRSPLDAVYSFTFASRDAGDEAFATLEQQHAFIDRMLALIVSPPPAENSGRTAPGLPSTRFIAASMDEIEPGDTEGFEDWLLENLHNMDRVVQLEKKPKGDPASTEYRMLFSEHYYWARGHFGDNLRRIARFNDASRLTIRTTELIERSPADKVRWHLDEYRYLDADQLKAAFYAQIENKNSLDGDNRVLLKVLLYALGLNKKSQDEYMQRYIYQSARKTLAASTGAEEEIISQGQTYMNALEIMTGSIGLDFYNIWHAIGVQYLLRQQGELPEDFPDAARWKDYYLRMTADGDGLENALAVHLNDEPDYLAALRRYHESGNLPAETAEQIAAVRNAVKQYEDLMDDSVLLYLMSDWHYACISGTYNPRASAADESDTESRRIERITSRTNHIFDAHRTDIANIPRSLLILSELGRINAAPSGRHNPSELASDINSMLAECGYALLDVRKRLDLMFYAAISISVAYADRGSFSLDDVLSALHEYIRAHTFSGIVRDILEMCDADLPIHTLEKKA